MYLKLINYLFVLERINAVLCQWLFAMSMQFTEYSKEASYVLFLFIHVEIYSTREYGRYYNNEYIEAS